jgi:predicted nucleic acid-binding protein
VSVLVDTPIWSLALRRKAERLGVADRRLVEEWKDLVRQGRARLSGAIRQETLSGIRDRRDFERLREHLAAFDDVPAGTDDHERAADFFNACRAHGVTPTSIDMLICALATQHGLTIFTTDRDFVRYATVLPIRLHAQRPRSPAAR